MLLYIWEGGREGGREGGEGRRDRRRDRRREKGVIVCHTPSFHNNLQLKPILSIFKIFTPSSMIRINIAFRIIGNELYMTFDT